jgi:hypothetical protein
VIDEKVFSFILFIGMLITLLFVGKINGY